MIFQYWFVQYASKTRLITFSVFVVTVLDTMIYHCVMQLVEQLLNKGPAGLTVQ
jgi:hypothetical protein